MASHGPEWAEPQQNAVRYAEGTTEWRILNRPLGTPPLRVRPASAHRPTTRELFKKAIEKSGKTVPNVDPSSQFRYSKIDHGEIRLLRLYPSRNPDDPLKADMFKRKLDTVEGQYEALSYCWGDGTAENEIQIRDLNATRSMAVVKAKSQPDDWVHSWFTTPGAITHTEFKIGKNLHDALKRLRRRHGDVYLWVDAICIDQSPRGLGEKSEQLAMMARIFHLASTVCVWLGEDDGEAQNAFALARDIMNYQRFDDLIHDVQKAVAWRDLATVMRADWFSRRWIIQEIALSRNATIHCGRHSLHWDDFADAVSLLVEKIELMRVDFRDEVFDDIETSSASILIQTLSNLCRKSDDKHNRGAINSRLLDIETLVSTLLAFQASFPRDTIFSILSLAKDFPTEREGWESLHDEQIDTVTTLKLRPIHRQLGRLARKKDNLTKDLDAEAASHKEVRAALERVGEIKRALVEARQMGKVREVEQLIAKVDEYDEERLLLLIDDHRELAIEIQQTDVQIKRFQLKYQRTKEERYTNLVSVLPNYKFSPRDLFIAFVTRSIYKTKSLDIICRHWAPDLTNREDGAGQMPSWISGRSRASFGVPGTARGRQNGENLVGYLPHDQRRRYSASGVNEEARIEMLLDPRILNGEGVVTIAVPDEQVYDEPRSDEQMHKEEPLRPLAAVSRQGTQGSASKSSGVGSGAVQIDVAGPTTTAASERRSIRSTSGDRRWRSIARGWRAPFSRGQTPIEERQVHVQEDPDFQNGLPSGLGEGPAPVNVAEELIPDVGQVDEGADGSVTPTDGALPGDFQRATGWGQRKPKKWQPVGSDFPSASVWAPGPHQLSGILVVTGFVLGRIRSQSEVMRGGVIPGEWVTKLGWERDGKNHVPDMLWRLLVADRTPNGSRPPLWYKRAFLHGLVDMNVSDNAGNIHPVKAQDRKISEMTTNYFKRVESVVWNRRLFDLTYDEEGKASHWQDDRESEETSRATPLYGLGPGGSRVDDIVCILYGCSVPVVLKVAENPTVEDLYEVVGEAYVDGVMDGEFMTGRWKETARSFRLG